MKTFIKTNLASRWIIAIFCSLFVSSLSFGQITITSDDMPNTGDTLRMSTNITTGGIDYTLSGENYTWDFSTLFPLVQTVDTFESVTSVPFLYQLVFIPGVVANLAQPYSGFDLIPGLDITDPYRFYKVSSSNFKDVGFALTLNSIPLPIKFDNPDILYDFPVSYGNVDSCFSGFELGIPDLGFVGIDRKRVNTADGWGTLITPYGTFEALRIKSEVFETDTIYIDSLNFGTTIERIFTEYKWMGNGIGVPLLQVTEEGPIVTVAYRDSIRNPITAITENEMEGFSFNVFPNPASSKATIKLLNKKSGIVDISLFNLSGIKVREFYSGHISSGNQLIGINLENIPSGIYFVTVIHPEGTSSKKIVKE